MNKLFSNLEEQFDIFCKPHYALSAQIGHNLSICMWTAKKLGSMTSSGSFQWVSDLFSREISMELTYRPAELSGFDKSSLSL